MKLVKVFYKFQFNNDEISCIALRDMIKQGWTLDSAKVEGGYHWLILQKDTFE